MSSSHSRRSFLKIALMASAAAAAQSPRVAVAAPAGKTASVLVIGAGPAGAAAAWYLQSRGVSVTILEARERMGGRIHSNRTTWPDFVAEYGANWVMDVADTPVPQFLREHRLSFFDTNLTDFGVHGEDGQAISPEDLASYLTLFSAVLAEALTLAVARQEALMPDISLRAGINYIYQQWELPAYATVMLDRLLNSLIESPLALEAAELSFYSWAQDENAPSANYVLPSGYVSLVETLVKNTPVYLNTEVLRIAYNGVGVQVTTNRGVFSADQVIVTIPLGVLKNSPPQFYPPLPATKQAAIDALEMKIEDKFFFRFPYPFWESDRDFLFLRSPYIGRWGTWFNFHKYTGVPILCAFNGGEFARELESLGDGEVILSAMAHLQYNYGAGIPLPTGLVRSKWGQEKFTQGAISSLPVGATGEEYDAMAEPIDNRLFWAGEATTRRFCGTVHGAFMSGQREAARLLAQRGIALIPQVARTTGPNDSIAAATDLVFRSLAR